MIQKLDPVPWWAKARRDNRKNSYSLFGDLLKDKNIYKVEKKDGFHFIYYLNGCIFKCKGEVVDDNYVEEYKKVITIKRKFIKGKSNV